MTRNLRKRHLKMWIAIAVILAALLIYSRLNVPVFSGENTQKTELK